MVDEIIITIAAILSILGLVYLLFTMPTPNLDRFLDRLEDEK